MGRVWIAATLLLLIGCSTKSDANKRLDREVTGVVLFESYTVDMTWGYRLSGMYIDGDGNVWSYERTGTPWYPEQIKVGELSPRDLLTKHNGARKIGTVDRAKLRDMAQLIKPAAKGPIAKASDVGAGGGSVELAYLFDPDKSMYHEVILAGQGDRVANNAAPEARLLLDYLREVKQSVGMP